MKSISMIICAACLAALRPSAAEGQHAIWSGDTTWTGFRDVHQRDDCRLAHQVLTLGQPAVKREWAFTIIGGCGPLGGEALVHQLRLHLNDSEPTDSLELLIWSAADLLDGALFRSALDLSRNTTAGIAARVAAVRIIYGMLDPGNHLSYRFITSTSLSIHSGFTAYPRYGAPLPRNARQEVADVMHDLVHDASSPEALQNAARKLYVLANTR